MANNKDYRMVKLAKMIVNDEPWFIIKAFIEDPVETSPDLKVAIISVLAAGSSYQMNQFFMPSTRAVLDILPDIRNKVKNRRHIYMNNIVWNYPDGHDLEEGICIYPPVDSDL